MLPKPVITPMMPVPPMPLSTCVSMSEMPVPPMPLWTCASVFTMPVPPMPPDLRMTPVPPTPRSDAMPVPPIPPSPQVLAYAFIGRLVIKIATQAYMKFFIYAY